MKLKDWIIAFILTTIIIVLGKYSQLEFENRQRIENLKNPIQIVKVEPIKVDAALVERIEELVRENQRLEWEVAALRDEAEAFGWLKAAADKEGLNP